MYVIYAAIGGLLLSITDGKTPDHNGMKMIQENYSDEVDILSLDVEMPILKQLFKDTPVVCFSDIVDKLQLLPDERQLIPNIIVLCNLLLINPATSATPERSFSLARCIRTWQRATMTQKHFNSLAILNFHKHQTDRIDLVSVGNDFIAKYHEIYSTSGEFSESDFV